MFFFMIFLVMAGIAGAAVWAGMMETSRNRRNNAPGGHRLSNREKVNLAKVAGVMPNRKEN